ncbi:MAG: hypothetical protein A2Y14_01065 [Verrucomicrobia bacterium GWF2_51_19]|nr:MAG: hypothetical protein A2Y14_01065 [Verrucomicrobia bacterium GWF2_51_19]
MICAAEWRSKTSDKGSLGALFVTWAGSFEEFPHPLHVFALFIDKKTITFSTKFKAKIHTT